MFDFSRDRLLSLTQAADLLPPGRGGRPTHHATLVRWITHGVAGPAGGRVRLRPVKVASRCLIPAASLSEFAAALTPGAGPDTAGAGMTAPVRTAARNAADTL